MTVDLSCVVLCSTSSAICLLGLKPHHLRSHALLHPSASPSFELLGPGTTCRLCRSLLLNTAGVPTFDREVIGVEDKLGTTSARTVDSSHTMARHDAVPLVMCLSSSVFGSSLTSAFSVSPQRCFHGFLEYARPQRGRTAVGGRETRWSRVQSQVGGQ